MITHCPTRHLAASLLLAAACSMAQAESEEVGCVTTTWKLIGALIASQSTTIAAIALFVR